MEENENQHQDNSIWIAAIIYIILHIIIAVLCIVVCSKLNEAIKSIEESESDLILITTTILLAAFSNFASAIAIIVRVYDRQKLEKKIIQLENKLERYEKQPSKDNNSIENKGEVNE